MTKQHLGIFAIVAVSLIMGIPSLMVEAERPGEEVSTDAQSGLNVSPIEGQIVCGFDDAYGIADYTSVTTAYKNGNQDKLETVETYTGDFFTLSNGAKLGTFSMTVTILEDESGKEKGKGADSVVKKRITVNCLDDSVEKAVDVSITHRN